MDNELTQDTKRVIIYCLNYYEEKEELLAASVKSVFHECLEEARHWMWSQDPERTQSMNDPMSSITKLILLEALKEYKDTDGKTYHWGEDDAKAIDAAGDWLYGQMLPEDKSALQERYDQIDKELDDLVKQIGALSDKRYELILEIVKVRKLMEERDGN